MYDTKMVSLQSFVVDMMIQNHNCRATLYVIRRRTKCHQHFAVCSALMAVLFS